MTRHRSTLHALPLCLGAGALAWILAPGIATAQDGQGRTGDPVTGQRTNKENPRPNTSTPPRQTTGDVLPPVPASPSDPAPPGTRGVLVGPDGAPLQAGDPGRNASGRRAADNRAGIRSVEGVVTAVRSIGGDSGNTRGAATGPILQVWVDPAQDWADFATRGPVRQVGEADAGAALAERAGADVADPPGDKAGRDEQAESSRRRGEVNRERVPEGADGEERSDLPIVITSQTRMHVHARTPDGADLYNVGTYSSPSTRPSGVGVTGRLPARPAGPMETNVTNLRVGSFVTIRYRAVGDANEAVNVNLVELPLRSPEEGGRVPRSAPAAPATPTTGADADRVPAGDGRRPVAPAVPADPIVPGAPR